MGKRIDVDFSANESASAAGASDKPPALAEPDKRTVAEWTKALDMRRSIVAGAAHLAGWQPDTMLTRKAFEAGVAKYSETSMGG